MTVKYAFFILLAILPMVSRGQTVINVQGRQTGVWDADTVWVTGDVEVADSLMIMPGTTVLFDGFYGITVSDGSVFKAQGNADDSIVFSITDTLGFFIYNIEKGGWNGLRFDRAGKVRMDYCKIQYGKASSESDQHGGAMNVLSSNDVEINNSTFFCNFAREHGGAINAENSKLVFSGCEINDNKLYADENVYYMYGAGARFLKCDVVMTDMEFRNNYGEISIGGALSLDSCSVIMDRAVFSNNIGLNGGGFYIMRCNHKTCRLSNLLIYDNFSRHFAGGMAFSDASPEVYNVTVYGNRSEGVTCNGVFYFQNSSPKITNCIVYGNYPDYEGITMDTIQQWVWTFDGFAPEFRNCLFENGLKSFSGAEHVVIYEDVIDVDPCFVDPENRDFHLREDSPCRDAGKVLTPNYILESVDLDGLPRLANRRIDLGTYEYSPAEVQESVNPSTGPLLLGNPLNEQSRIVLNLQQAGPVVVRIFDVLGRLVAEKPFGWHEAGLTYLSFGDQVAELNEGVYLIEVILNNSIITLKAIK